MPYIPKERRNDYDKEIKSLVKNVVKGEESLQKFQPGDLTYIICKLIDVYVESRGVEYANYCVAMGILITSEKEYYRTKVAPYEDKAMKKNGVL